MMALSVLRNIGGGARICCRLGLMMERGGSVAAAMPIRVQEATMLMMASQTMQQQIRDYSKRYQQQQHPHKPAPTHNDATSESESDSDLDVVGHRGESQFWRRKIRTFHGILDVNNDGVISFDDFALLADRFVNLGHLSETHTQEFRALLQDLWEKRWGEISPYNLVTVEQYLEDMHHILNDKHMVRRAHSFLPYLFRAVDRDHSGEISVDEYKLFFECLGLNETDAVLAFRAIDTNADGKINIKEFTKHGRDFFLTEDPMRISKYFWGPLVDH